MIDVSLDIETIGNPYLPKQIEDSFMKGVPQPEPITPPEYAKDKDREQKQQRYIEAKTLEQAEKIEAAKSEVKSSFALYPLTGRIACICLFVTKGKEPSESFRFVNLDEKVILTDFWKCLQDIQLRLKDRIRFISYNGKDFDVPFIKLRSAVHRIPMSVPMNTKRYDVSGHFDVREVVCNFNIFGKKGKLDDYLALFELEGKLAAGGEVSEMWEKKEFDKLTDYCLGDCIKTYQLAEILMPYFLPPSWAR